MTRLKGPESPGARIALAAGAVIIIAGGAWLFSSGSAPEEGVVTQPPARKTRTITTSADAQPASAPKVITATESADKATTTATTSVTTLTKSKEGEEEKEEFEPGKNSEAATEGKSTLSGAVVAGTPDANAPLPSNTPQLAPAPPVQNYNQQNYNQNYNNPNYNNQNSNTQNSNQPRASGMPMQPNSPGAPQQPMQPVQPMQPGGQPGENLPAAQSPPAQTRRTPDQARPRTSTGGGMFKPYQDSSPVISDEG